MRALMRCVVFGNRNRELVQADAQSERLHLLLAQCSDFKFIYLFIRAIKKGRSAPILFPDEA